MTIHHLSHTDLDGYGAQVITNHYFKNVKFYNSNYGKEIDEKFDQILAQISDKNAVSAESNLGGEQNVPENRLVKPDVVVSRVKKLPRSFD